MHQCSRCRSAVFPGASDCPKCGRPMDGTELHFAVEGASYLSAKPKRIVSLSRGQARFHYALATMLALVVALGAMAAAASSDGVTRSLSLEEGANASISVFRLMPHEQRLSLELRINRRDHGQWGDSRQGDFFDFQAPGQPIAVEVKTASGTQAFWALPAQGTDMRFERWLVPVTQMETPNRYRWNASRSPVSEVPAGSSQISVTVTQVGEGITGQVASLYFWPPLSLKYGSANYSFLWWFFFWPFMCIPLLAYVSVVVWLANRSGGVKSDA
jgi:hypothetical protein